MAADGINICAVEKTDLWRHGQITSGFIFSEMMDNLKLLCSLSCFRLHVEVCRALMRTQGSKMNQTLGGYRTVHLKPLPFLKEN